MSITQKILIFLLFLFHFPKTFNIPLFFRCTAHAQHIYLRLDGVYFIYLSTTYALH